MLIRRILSESKIIAKKIIDFLYYLKVLTEVPKNCPRRTRCKLHHQTPPWQTQYYSMASDWLKAILYAFSNNPKAAGQAGDHPQDCR